MIDKKSYIEHHNEYSQDIALERERVCHEKYDSNEFEFIYQGGIPHGKILDETNFKVAVDVGSGTGWFSNYIVEQRNYEKVYAIEPSDSAVEIAKKIYPLQEKVEWMNGFSQDRLKEIELTDKTLFSTLCVLAHIEDESVINILTEVDKIAPPKSVFCFSEPWGDWWHQHCWHIRRWHIRPTNWWKDVLPNWKFEFDDDCKIGEKQYKGFVAVKEIDIT